MDLFIMVLVGNVNMKIEYRVWDVENSIMIYRPVSSSDEIFISPTGQLWKVNQTNPSAVLNMLSPEKFIVLRFTGLKDKNGKKIYEADIVNINHPDDYEGGDFKNKPGRVFWDENEAAFYHGHCTVKGGSTRPPKRMWEYCEVIGNEFENPELMEDN